MKGWFQKLTDVSTVARTKEMFNEALTELAQELGFEYYAYLNLQPIGTFAVSNYHPEWQDWYFAKSFNEIDPVIQIARATMKAFTWSSENSRTVRSRRVRQFYLDAAGFGIRSGITIPVATAFRRIAMLTMASHKPSLSLKGDVDPVAAAMAVAQLHVRIEQTNIEPTAKPSIALTTRQALMLKWASEGKSMRAIADIENMSYWNVNFHMNNARRKLNAYSLPQATALATKLKLI
ncbi:autoinducer binding domain-containing protein (plasmid) [Ensifer adhaerens]|uniref:autoinducer binding domain-containing protein n=1 Tax=Ensifer TaxID=106591 RepID=UPI0008E4268D|nr:MULTISPECIES: autoinducer binding domain-containing protein [Ensifer]UTV39306.1 autoinducer binding domain-containing protein [Ensifer adhaerens]SFH03902.1 DNA-binding transcriptional regulator, CsgD family [Ensifer sp. OV372]